MMYVHAPKQTNQKVALASNMALLQNSHKCWIVWSD